MSLLRRLDTHTILYASFALLLCLGAGLSLWLLTQLGHLSATASAPRLQAGYAGARLVTAAGIGVTLAAGAALALWLRAAIARPLQAATAMAHRIAEGNLSSQIGLAAGAEAGQLCEAMQHMNDTLAAMVAKLRGGTEHIAASAGQIAAASMLQTARCDEQAAALAQAESALQQLGAGLRQHGDQAQQAALLAAAACDEAAVGSSHLATLAEALGDVDAAGAPIAALAGQLDALAFQTTMLALNAGVEATRAGPHGAAFGVVAAEVRQLALRSGAAARELKTLAAGARGDAAAGAMLAARARHSLLELAQKLARGCTAADATESAPRQAAERLQQALAAIGQGARQATQLAAESATASASLREQAACLSRASAAFVLGPEHGVQAPAIHLVASNPHRLRTARALAPLVSVPRLARAGAGARELDWNEF